MSRPQTGGRVRRQTCLSVPFLFGAIRQSRSLEQEALFPFPI